MAHPDFLPRLPGLDIPGLPIPPGIPAAAALALALHRLHQDRRKPKRKGKDPDRGGVPVEPNRPNTLTGGAAAALEFDD
jgi:hypothetical protein